MRGSKTKGLLHLACAVVLQAGVAFHAGASAAEEDLQKGAAAMKANDFRAAVAHFERALGRNPNNASIVSSLALCLVGLGRFDEAAARFQTLTRLQPAVPEHHYNLGLAFLNLGEAEKAESSFRQVLHLAPGRQRAQVQLANALLAQARAGNASKMRAAAQAYEKAVAGSPQDPELRFNLAFTLARLGDENGALKQYQEVIRLKPNFPEAQFSLGVTRFQLGNFEEAAPPLREALRRGRADFHLHYYLGSALLKLGHLNEAGQHLQAAAQLNTEHAGVHFQLAAFHRAQGDSARVTTEQAIFRELTDRQDAKWRAEALQRAAEAALSKGDLKQGISALVQAYEARPDATLARNLGLAYIQSGNVREARRLLHRALELSPQDAAVYNYLGLLEAREGNLSQAELHFQKAADLDPSLVDALYNGGLAAFQLGQTDIAIQRLKAALARSDTPRLREALALVLDQAGRHEEAQQQFEKAQRQQGGAERFSRP